MTKAMQNQLSPIAAKLRCCGDYWEEYNRRQQAVRARQDARFEAAEAALAAVYWLLMAIASAGDDEVCEMLQQLDLMTARLQP